MKTKLLSFLCLFSFVMSLNAQEWEDLGYTNGTVHSAGQVLSYNGKLILFHSESGVFKVAISTDNGKNFTSTDLTVGLPTNDWKLSANGILYATAIDFNNILFHKILLIDLNQTPLTQTILERGDYDTDSSLTAFAPSTKCHGPNGEIWLGNLMSNDDGKTWIKTGVIFAPQYIGSDGMFYRFQSGGETLKSTDTAKTWISVSKGAPFKSIGNITFRGANADTIIMYTSDLPCVSFDNGLNYTTIGYNLGIGGWNGITASNKDMYIYKNYDQIYKMPLGGSNWDTTSSFSFKTITSMCEHSNGGMFATVGGLIMSLGGDTTGTGDTSGTVNSTNNIDLEFESSFHVYPNPSNGNVNISISSLSLNSNLNVRDLIGNVVYSEKLKSTNQKLNLTSLPKGIYLLELDESIRKVILD